jgi:hypothetical protein
MQKTAIFALLLILSIVLFYQLPPLAAAPARFDEATPTPAAAEEAAEPAEDEPTLHDLAARIDALEAQVAEIVQGAVPRSTSADASAVTTAVYLLDTAGLHDLDVRLNEEQVIEAGDAGHVARVARLLSSVSWPETLAADAETLIGRLTELATALGEDDVDAAAPLATQAHETQHDFSHAAEEWLGEADLAAMPEPTGQPFRVTAAVYLLDTAGLHDLDVRLNEEQVIEASDAGSVARVARLLSAVDWPDELAEDAAALGDVLTELAEALRNDDLEAAAPLATEAHETQHDFSHAAEDWLGETLGIPAEAATDSHAGASATVTDTQTITHTATITATEPATDTEQAGG